MDKEERKVLIDRYKKCKDPRQKDIIWKYVHAMDSIKTREYQRGRYRITKEQRRNSKRREVEKLRRIQEPGEDGVYLYVQSFEEGLYKVGISDVVTYRNKQLEYQGMPNNAELKILYIGKPLKGSAKDAESIAHYDLDNVNEVVTYQDGTRSREWFRCDLDNLIFYLNTCVADMKEYKNN